jgi:putative membrane protein
MNPVMPLMPMSNSLIATVIHWFLSAGALLITAHLVKGFQVSSFTAALIAAVIIGIANILVWPILIVLTLPLNILTLGLFTFVVNGIVLRLCSALVSGFDIKSWGAAIFGSIVLSLVSLVLHLVFV